MGFLIGLLVYRVIFDNVHCYYPVLGPNIINLQLSPSGLNFRYGLCCAKDCWSIRSSQPASGISTCIDGAAREFILYYIVLLFTEYGMLRTEHLVPMSDELWRI